MSMKIAAVLRNGLEGRNLKDTLRVYVLVLIPVLIISVVAAAAFGKNAALFVVPFATVTVVAASYFILYAWPPLRQWCRSMCDRDAGAGGVPSETLREFDVVALLQDMPANQLSAGDVGAIVHCYGTGNAYEVEFLDAAGKTRAVVTVEARQLLKLNGASVATH